jgi:hypothetical protein
MLTSNSIGELDGTVLETLNQIVIMDDSNVYHSVFGDMELSGSWPIDLVVHWQPTVSYFSIFCYDWRIRWYYGHDADVLHFL